MMFAKKLYRLTNLFNNTKSHLLLKTIMPYQPKYYYIDKSFNQNMIIALKPLTIFTKEMLMNIKPTPGTFGKKDDVVTLLKTGYTSVEFMPVSKDIENKNVIHKEDKTFFILSLKQMGKFLKIEDTKETIQIQMQNSKTDSDDIRYLSIEKKDSSDFFTFTLKVVSNNTVKSIRSVNVTEEEFALIKDLFKFSIPYVMGWHALDEHKFNEGKQKRAKIC